MPYSITSFLINQKSIGIIYKLLYYGSRLNTHQQIFTWSKYARRDFTSQQKI